MRVRRIEGNELAESCSCVFPTVGLAGWRQAEADAGNSAAGTSELEDRAVP